ncbi:MAG: hypothetical protein GY731_20185 [Gammaproteobacteria bacterium]|nr:hypothetical protein [Gammaproteobacteria bacterium]
MSDFLDRYGLVFGEQSKEAINSKEGVEFIQDAFAYASRIFYEYTEPSLGPVTEFLDLNSTILKSAIESAFIDLYQSSLIHELIDAPSPAKKGASVIAWINRLKPIQVIRDTTESKVIFVNSVFALHVGWTMYWQLALPDKLGDISGVCLPAAENLANHDLSNDFIYHLMWRNPGFRELTLLLQSIAPKSR